MDLKELLDEYDVRVWRRGKNVSKGWIGLTCPFCGDTSNHLGINLKTHSCRCWKCGPKKFTSVLEECLGISKHQAVLYAKQLDPSEDAEVDITTEDHHDGNLSIQLPKEALKRFPDMHYRYLRSRGFPVLRTIREYKLRAVKHLGPYKFRIIIPVVFNGRIVSFTSRDVTGKAEPKYKAAPQNLYPNPKHYVYNQDSLYAADMDAVLVEGPTDVWRLGPQAISLFGVQHHGRQLLHLAKKKIRRLHIMFDNDEPGYRAAGVLAKSLRSLCKEVNIVTLTEASDPGSLTREQGEIIMRTLGIKR